MNWYLDVLCKYAVFSGRASRSEYWWFTLINSLIVMVICFGAIFFAGKVGGSPTKGLENAYIMMAVYLLVTLLPTIAVQVRRLHDIGYSGWWYFLVFVPFGSLVLIVLACFDSQPGPNQYGPNPKEVNALSVAT